MSTQRLAPGASCDVGDADADTLLFAFAGHGTLSLSDEAHELAGGSAALVLAGETARIDADGELAVLASSVGPGVDLHAPIGPRAVVSRLESVEAGSATGRRSFQVLFGPHNGSVRATLFVGYIPPGRAPWHYHLYDEIVWVYDGEGRLHLGDDTAPLRRESAFRLRPRDLHIVENTSEEAELAVLGVFTPAGSPAAAFLPPGSDYEYGMTER